MASATSEFQPKEPGMHKLHKVVDVKSFPQSAFHILEDSPVPLSPTLCNFENKTNKVAEGLYTYLVPFNFFNLVPINNRSIIIHCPSTIDPTTKKSTLVVINPTNAPDSLWPDLRALESTLNASVRYLISPGDWHYMYFSSWLKAFPTAKAYIPPGRPESKMHELKPQNLEYDYELIDVMKDNPFPELEPDLKVLTFRGLGQIGARETLRWEFVFLHVGSGCVTSGDVLYYNRQRRRGWVQWMIGQDINRIDFHFAKWSMVRHGDGIRYSLQKILEWDFDRYISVHGNVGNALTTSAKEQVQELLEKWARCQPAPGRMPWNGYADIGEWGPAKEQGEEMNGGGAE
ncbi:hypothetical protein HK102_012007 [Quaeritorhiza haematococci]|nr:hypothetical protein HK102_012007 [Quaeritorhiza haematococci]